MTETCSGDTLMEAGREIEKIGSVGRALAHVEIEIRDEAGRTLPPGESGEICLRGPKVTRGYWRDPEKTRASFFGDWLRSGDIGHMDADGFLYLTDRKKDMIISGGENIASSEVERVVYELPQVQDAAVIGVADERWGERPVAVVVLKPGAALTLEALQQHCRAKLAGFKMPKELIVRTELPRNPSGKILKRALREEIAARPPRAEHSHDPAHHQGLHRLQEPLRLPRQGPHLRARARHRRAHRLAALHARHPGLPRQRQGRRRRHRARGDAQRAPVAARQVQLHGLPPRGQPARPHHPRPAQDLRLLARPHRHALRAGPRRLPRLPRPRLRAFWKRELDIESPAALVALLSECGADAAGFPAFAESEGRRRLADIRAEAEAAGVFGVPSFLLEDGDLYWGREHLPRIRELLAAAR